MKCLLSFSFPAFIPRIYSALDIPTRISHTANHTNTCHTDTVLGVPASVEKRFLISFC
jgi:hypothetical protein